MEVVGKKEAHPSPRSACNSNTDVCKLYGRPLYSNCTPSLGSDTLPNGVKGRQKFASENGR